MAVPLVAFWWLADTVPARAGSNIGDQRQSAAVSARMREMRYERSLRTAPDGMPPLARTTAIDQMNAMAESPQVVGMTWTPIGPAPIENGQAFTTNGYCAVMGVNTRLEDAGRISSVAINSGGTVYIGAANGGVWRGIGNVFTPMTDAQTIPSTAIGALALVSPSANPATDIVYAGTGEGNTSCDTEFGQGIIKSTDGGATWTQLAAATFDRQSFTKIAIPFDPITPNDPMVLYATTTFGVSGSAAAECPSVTTSTTGLYRSADRGMTWALVSGNGGLPAGGGNNAPSGSGTDVVVPSQLQLKASAWDGTNVDMGGGGCPGSAQMSLDMDPTHRSVISITKDPVSGFDFNGTLWMLQGAGICDDYSGQYSCSGTVDHLDGGMAMFDCFGATDFKSMGTFNLNHDGTGTFTGTWSMSDSSGPDVVSNGTFNWNAMPTVYAGIAQQGVYQSTDAGMTWTAAGMGGGNTRYALDINADGSVVIFAAANSGANPQTINVFNSSDGGMTWNAGAAIVGNAAPGVTAGCITEGQVDYDLAIVIDPNVTTQSLSFSTVYLGGVGLYSSSDGGTTFTFVGNGAHPDQHALRIDQFGQVYAGNDGGLFGQVPGDAQWTTNNGSFNINQFQGIALPPTGASQVFGGTQDNGTNLYSGMNQWQHAIDGDGGWTIIDAANPSVVFGETQNLGLQRSSMGTTPNSILGSFTNIAPPAGANNFGFFLPITADPNNVNRILLGTDHVWESCAPCNAIAGSPVNWRPIGATVANPGGINLTVDPAVGGAVACANDSCDIDDLAIAPTNSDVLYVVTSSDTGQFMRTTAHPAYAWVSQNSTQAAPTFTNITGTLPTNRPLTSVAVSPLNPAEALVTSGGFSGGAGGHVFHTTNFGAAWTDISVPLPNIPALSVIFDYSSPLDTYYVGTDIGVFRTTDGGATWAGFNLNSLPIVPVYMLRQNHNIIAAATHGRGVWTVTDTTPGALMTSPAILKFKTAVKVSKHAKKPVALTVTNPAADTDPVSFGAPQLTGANAGDFAIAANTCTRKLLPGKHCTVSISFSPTVKGARTATLELIDNATNTPQMISITGKGK